MRHYLDTIGARIGVLCGMDIREPRERRLLRIYAVLCLARGTTVRCEHVHDAWAVECRDDHPCAVPFDRLPPDSQALDVKYRDAIRLVAAELAQEGN